MSTFTIPELALVALVGASGSGKSTFAHKHFKPTEVVSSDTFRGLVSDDESDQSATEDAFDALYYLVKKRLARGLLTVVDATNVQLAARKKLLAIAREMHVLGVAIVLAVPEKVCQERNEKRPNRAFGPNVIRRQSMELRQSLRGLGREGFRHVRVLSSVEQIDEAVVQRVPLWVNKRDQHGPFDIIGDIHGCYDELVLLLTKLGYRVEGEGDAVTCVPPPGRRAIFLGDLVDRGPKTPAVLRLAMAMVASGAALAVPGNHDTKLVRKLSGKNVKLTHGLKESVEQLALEPPAFVEQARAFIDDLVSHFVLDDGKLVVAHAGLKEAFQGRSSGAVREFCLFGETTGEIDEVGLPVRADWAAQYRGKAMVVYGHTPTTKPIFHNGTICIDTGCVFGGALTALRYPERDIVSIPAAREYYAPVRVLTPAGPARAPDLLEATDVLGRRSIETRLLGPVTIGAETSAAALESMSRFAVDPRWLPYLPPTMSPCDTAKEGPYLEHPKQALGYYAGQGVTEVVVEEKHMGSRAIIVVCRDAETAKARFGDGDRLGIVVTRTGRPFFKDEAYEKAILDNFRDALTHTHLWDELRTGFAIIDAEIMPWSLKAGELIRRQYAAVGSSGTASLDAALAALDRAQGDGVAELRRRFADRAQALHRYVESYRRYCWDVASPADIRVAPFHLLATDGVVNDEKPHAWHLEILSRLAQAKPGLIVETPHRFVTLGDAASEAEAIAWWEARTEAGGEGMVVKPATFLHRAERGFIQPAVKCRGREYLRIIYGPEYTLPEQLEKLRARGLGHKRSLAMKELALGLEALHRFVEGEPLYRVHECVFAVLALESEAVDPRL